MRLQLPGSGELLVTHLGAYGLATVLDAADVAATVGHDPVSQSFEPFVDASCEPQRAAELVRAAALTAEDVAERDIEPGLKGNDRRSIIWARASYANDPGRAEDVLGMRQALADAADDAGDRVLAGLLAGLGAPAAWREKPAQGATQLDGVIGNHTSDFVRGVLRPARRAAAALDVDETVRRWTTPTSVSEPDKTGWAPAGSAVHPVDQWLAALGLGLLPVAHRGRERSQTPAADSRAQQVTLPIVRNPVSVARLRALLALRLLRETDGHAAATRLRALGVDEVVTFRAAYANSAGSSVAFTFDRGRRRDLR